MVVSDGAANSLRMLKEMCEDGELVQSIVSLPRGTLSEQQSGNLRILSDWACEKRKSRKRKRNEEDNSEDDGEATDSARPPPAKRSRSWRAFENLKPAALRVPDHIESMIMDGGDPKGFLLHKQVLNKRFLKEQNNADAVITRYMMTVEVNGQITTCWIRWCFAMVMWYDLIMFIFPDCQGRIGKLMLKEVKDTIEPIMGQLNIPAKTLLKQINQWSLNGAKLDSLISIFGPACLFFLWKQLSSDFISNKFTWTGEPRNDAILHLRRLGLEEMTSEPGYHEYAQGIRDSLMQVFQGLEDNADPEGTVAEVETTTGDTAD